MDRESEPEREVTRVPTDAQISYGDLGVLYAFVCPKCGLLATVVQSH